MYKSSPGYELRAQHEVALENYKPFVTPRYSWYQALDTDVVANGFLRFFEEKVTKLPSAIKAGLHSSIIRPADILLTSVTTELSAWTSPEEVATLFGAAPSKKLPLGILPTPMMKFVRDKLSVVIACVVNRSFEKAEFSASMKVDLVNPLMKKQSRHE